MSKDDDIILEALLYNRIQINSAIGAEQNGAASEDVLTLLMKAQDRANQAIDLYQEQILKRRVEALSHAA